MANESKVLQTVTVSGKGDTKVAAISDALSKIQQTILKESQDVMLRIEPRSIEVLSALEKTRTEKFLFFFLPRTRTRFEVSLKVEIELLTMPVAAIVFKQEKDQQQEIHLPFISKKI